MQSSTEYIGDIRKASRDLVRELGFMGRTIAGTDLSASAVHAIIEIGSGSNLPAKMIAEKLCLEKSTVSRLVKSLVQRGLLSECRSKDDSRIKYLRLTEQGKMVHGEISQFGEAQVAGAIDSLDSRSKRTILLGLQSYSMALKSKRTQISLELAAQQVTEPQLSIKTGYLPGIIGRITTMNALYFSRTLGFGAVFEAKVAGGVAEFIPRIDKSCNQIWSVSKKGHVLGTIAIDGEILGEKRAQLRWFIIDDEQRGSGIGKRLIRNAMKFCDKQGFEETHLWTVKGLDAARKLYESHGFKLVEEYGGDQWGPKVLEQKYIRTKL